MTTYIGPYKYAYEYPNGCKIKQKGDIEAAIENSNRNKRR